MRSSEGRRRGLAASCATPPPSAIQVPRISLRTSWILIAPVLCGRCASADSAAMSRLSRYCSSCSKQMYRTLAWPPDATLRAICSAIVVLPVPWAPPMSASSPVRKPAPMVLSRGVKPSGTGWYSATLPPVTLSFRSTSTSSAERGIMLPLSVSSRHEPFGVADISVVTLEETSPGRTRVRGCIVAPASARTAARRYRSGGGGVHLGRPPYRGDAVPFRASAGGGRELIPEADDGADPAVDISQLEPLVGCMRTRVG